MCKTRTGDTVLPEDHDDQGVLPFETIDSDSDSDTLVLPGWASPTSSTDESPVFSDATVDIAWPSAGSKFHGQGLCKPCAWLWKPQGCLNGTACLHCHLCPKSEVKSRKKLRAKARKARVPGVPGVPVAAEDGSISAPGLAPSVLPLSIPPPPGLPPPGLSLPLPRIEYQPYPDSDPLEELESLEAQAAPAPPMPFQAEQEAQDSLNSLSSVGSLLHASGRCKPCGWFWKPKGCANGADCLHCHLCTASEARRKKRIASKMRANGSESQVPDQDQQLQLLTEALGGP
ncbi:unnamed protein product [Symbiodinium sp. CCMP2592]|nr:unnamed protein product [Symbiodinium sp. CCMP2592]